VGGRTTVANSKDVAQAIGATEEERLDIEDALEQRGYIEGGGAFGTVTVTRLTLPIFDCARRTHCRNAALFIACHFVPSRCAARHRPASGGRPSSSSSPDPTTMEYDAWRLSDNARIYIAQLLTPETTMDTLP
jgi:hypothetical protein